MYNYSIIIPHYNIPKLLKRLLKSIPCRSDIQVIVVDDCSTKQLDQLEQLKKEYDFVEWYSTEINGAGGKARNIGLQHAKGKYIIFADADDYFNYCFEDALEEYRNLDYDIIYFAVNSTDSETYHNSYREGMYNHGIDLYIRKGDELAVRYKRDAPWSKFIKKSIVDRNNIKFEESIISNDVKFSYLTDYYAKSTHPDNRAIYCVTTREGSTSLSRSREALLTSLRIDLEHRHFLNDHKLPVKSDIYYYLNNILMLQAQKDRNGVKEALKLCKEFGLHIKKVKMAVALYPILMKIKNCIK